MNSAGAPPSPGLGGSPNRTMLNFLHFSSSNGGCQVPSSRHPGKGCINSTGSFAWLSPLCSNQQPLPPPPLHPWDQRCSNPPPRFSPFPVLPTSQEAAAPHYPRRLLLIGSFHLSVLSFTSDLSFPWGHNLPFTPPPSRSIPQIFAAAESRFCWADSGGDTGEIACLSSWWDTEEKWDFQQLHFSDEKAPITQTLLPALCTYQVKRKTFWLGLTGW